MGLKRKKKGAEGGANWMDTYGDMVTLLLCFFVLLYSISTVDQAKWRQVVKSFNPDAQEVSQIVMDEDAQGMDEVPGNMDDGVTVDEAFDELYDSLKLAVNEYGLNAEVELYKGDGYTFVTFRDHVFFDGDSSVIKPEGKEVLKGFGKVLSKADQAIKEIQILGHTSQAEPDKQNNPETDRVLSAERSARVAAYIQTRSKVSADKIVSVGYGQFRPIAPFDTRENRAKNRRVEMLITKSDSVEQSLEEYYQEMNR